MLEALADAPDEGMTLSAIAHATQMSTSTAAAILSAMVEADYVERLPSRAYLLGPGLVRLMAGVRDRYPLLGAADEELSRLAALGDYGCTLARVNAADTEVVLTAGNTHGLATGHRMPLYPPYGGVAVAWRPSEAIDEWLTTAPEPLADHETEALRLTLAGIRERGYAAYAVAHDIGPVVREISQLIGQVNGADATSGETLRRILLNVATGVKVYTSDELATNRRRSVGYVTAPVFGIDRQPRYLVSLHLMRDAMSADELDRCVAELRHTTAALTAICS